MKARALVYLMILVATSLCLTGCGATRGMGNNAMGLGRTAWNLPRNLMGVGTQVGRGLTQSVMSSGRSAFNMGPRVLSVPAR